MREATTILMLRKIFVVVNSKRKKSQYVLVQFGNVPVSVDTSLLFSFTALRLNYLATMITADEANSSLDPYNEMLEKFSEFSGKATSLGSFKRKLESISN